MSRRKLAEQRARARLAQSPTAIPEGAAGKRSVGTRLASLNAQLHRVNLRGGQSSPLALALQQDIDELTFLQLQQTAPFAHEKFVRHLLGRLRILTTSHVNSSMEAPDQAAVQATVQVASPTVVQNVQQDPRKALVELMERNNGQPLTVAQIMELAHETASNRVVAAETQGIMETDIYTPARPSNTKGDARTEHLNMQDISVAPAAIDDPSVADTASMQVSRRFADRIDAIQAAASRVAAINRKSPGRSRGGSVAQVQQLAALMTTESR